MKKVINQLEAGLEIQINRCMSINQVSRGSLLKKSYQSLLRLFVDCVMSNRSIFGYFKAIDAD